MQHGIRAVERDIAYGGPRAEPALSIRAIIECHAGVSFASKPQEPYTRGIAMPVLNAMRAGASNAYEVAEVLENARA